jgi:hypothetical protein
MKKRMISPLLLLFLFATMVGCANDESVTAPVVDPELCDNGIDDDADGLIDCDDPDCVNDPNCTPELCDNGTDDDGDGLIDCDDPDCVNDPICTVVDPELCDNGIDDDVDGLTDCDDPDCVNDPICPCTSVVGWILNPDNGHLYRLTSGPLSIDDARAEADALCGYLVSIADQNENEFVRDNFSGPQQALTYCWIGLSDEINEGEWRWDSDEPFIPTNAQWIGGEPNGGAADNHVEMNTNPQGMPAANWGRWNDVGPNTIDKWGIIEMDI